MNFICDAMIIPFVQLLGKPCSMCLQTVPLKRFGENILQRWDISPSSVSSLYPPQGQEHPETVIDLLI